MPEKFGAVAAEKSARKRTIMTKPCVYAVVLGYDMTHGIFRCHQWICLLAGWRKLAPDATIVGCFQDRHRARPGGVPAFKCHAKNRQRRAWLVSDVDCFHDVVSVPVLVSTRCALRRCMAVQHSEKKGYRRRVWHKATLHADLHTKTSCGEANRRDKLQVCAYLPTLRVVGPSLHQQTSSSVIPPQAPLTDTIATLQGALYSPRGTDFVLD
jgi:hypothetical protein